jgi:hypothetical protein
MDEMLNPGAVGVVHRRHPEFPVSQIFAAPIPHIERRVEFGFTDTPAIRLRQYCFPARALCSDEFLPDGHKIDLDVGIQIRAETVGVVRAEIGMRQMHFAPVNLEQRRHELRDWIRRQELPQLVLLVQVGRRYRSNRRKRWRFTGNDVRMDGGCCHKL